MSNNSDLKTSLVCELLSKQTRLEVVTTQILEINDEIQKITFQFNTQAHKIQSRISKVQLSRPRGNPANYWPHCPMTPRINLFYQAKERKEKLLSQSKEILKLTFEHNRAIIINRKLILINEQSDIESQIKLIRIRLGLPINLCNWINKNLKLKK